MPQPYWGPVMPGRARSPHRRGVSGSASTDMGLPLTFRVIIEELLRKNPPQLFSALPAHLCRGQARGGGKPRHRDVPAGGPRRAPRAPARPARRGAPPLAGGGGGGGGGGPPPPPRRPPPPHGDHGRHG